MDMRVYLKICEGCGCLWYRTQLEVRVYCDGCNKRLKEFSTSRSRKRRGRPKKCTLPTVLAVHDPYAVLPGLDFPASESHTAYAPAWLPGSPSAALRSTGGAQ